MKRDRLTPTLFAANDLLLSLLACLLVAAFLIAAQKKQDETKETDPSAGDMSVLIFWPSGDVDIDLWLKSPDGDVVSFNKKTGTVWSLLRDDLGAPNDLTDRNYENAYARGLPPGEYVATAHAYRNSGKYPVSVDAELRIRSKPNTSPVVFNAHVVLDHTGDEAVLFRFTIDANGELVPGSVNNLSVNLARP